MSELVLTIIILVAIGAHAWRKDTERRTYDVMVPRDIQKGAQHAADVSQKSQVVVFDGSTYDIMRADNQHAARGQIMMVFHPKTEPVKAPRNIFVGACLKPNPAIEVKA